MILSTSRGPERRRNENNNNSCTSRGCKSNGRVVEHKCWKEPLSVSRFSSPSDQAPDTKLFGRSNTSDVPMMDDEEWTADQETIKLLADTFSTTLTLR